MPAPLVSAVVNLRNLPSMPLDVSKLRDSSFATKATGEAFHAAVLLWCASWHQLPAGSLPADDQELANLAGLGRAVAEWKRIKDGALYGWILCSDGRLYHPYIAKIVGEAWTYKMDYAYKKACDRIRKHNRQFEKTPEKHEEIPTLEAWMASESARLSAEIEAVSGGKFEFSSGNADAGAGIPAEFTLKEVKRSEMKRSEAKRKERKGTINPTSLTPSDSLTQILPDWLPADIWAAWCKFRGKRYTPLAMKLSIDKLSGLREQGEDPVQVIRQSMECEWKGLFAVKNKGIKNQRGGRNESKQSIIDELTGAGRAGSGFADSAGRTFDHRS